MAPPVDYLLAELSDRNDNCKYGTPDFYEEKHLVDTATASYKGDLIVPEKSLLAWKRIVIIGRSCKLENDSSTCCFLDARTDYLRVSVFLSQVCFHCEEHMQP
ncbi:hypothetical protein AAFF_G00000980 [Aldrovandia affinis]|uniref:Uncharacterized protein n=1 Tax=Aldrovandia affinis TaxID=143900 RepID=A0AAD7TCV2_9TELE|nr:hypothetical protein AAFF_G00000980 [Aldrovandia affinis]